MSHTRRRWTIGGLVAVVAAAGLALFAWPRDAISTSSGGTVSGTVTFSNRGNRPAASIVVYLREVPGPIKHTRAVVAQKDKQFTPGLTVVTRGSTVDFPNNDKIFHNVFSVSRTARFDLGLYKSGSSKSVKMRRTGDVDVYCNIHPKMIAKIKVVDSNFYAVTRADGTFRIDNVPPGTYPIVAWQAHGEQYEGRVTVRAGKTSQLQLRLRQGNAPRHHLRKDGTPYGRYQ